MSRHLVQILVPKFDGRGELIPTAELQELARELAESFGGVTCYLRAPAVGLWQPGGESPIERDEIVIFEVMTGAIDRAFWRRLRTGLEDRFKQAELVIRSHPVELL
jgi:hypothetical protein